MILVVDHYDSFTYNLVQLIEGLGRPTDVVKSDEAPAEELIARDPEAVVLSPGPGHPRDAGFAIRVAETITELEPGNQPATFFWVLAQRTGEEAA